MTALRDPAAFDIDAAVGRLIGLAATKRAARRDREAQAIGHIVATQLRWNISDYPEPSPEWTAAHDALQAFAGELAAGDGVDRMTLVYDAAVEQYGYRAVQGVSASWDGCHGWWH